jgi:hypothetical protein
MAYDSDTRVKETLKEISRNAKLKNLSLRIFDESRDDQRHWTKGGLTFGPEACLYGSNDAGWFLKRPYLIDNKKVADFTPVLVVEGSYGTETGNTGSAQYARFSHALGAVMEGFIGVYFIPFESTYRKADGSETTAYVRYDMIYAALNASEAGNGEYLFIDAYDTNLMGEFLKVLDEGDKGKIDAIIKRIKQIMKDFADKHSPKAERVYLYDDEHIGKLLMFNVVSFSAYNFRTKKRYKAGRFRNGHTIVGDALINLYWHKKPFDLVLARFTHEDCKNLDSLKQKEWLLLRTHENIRVITLDDLEFKDGTLKKRLYDFIDELPLLRRALIIKNELAKEILDGFQNKNIKINEESVRVNKYGHLPKSNK